MTATLPDRDAHAGAAADARADRLAEHAERLAWVTALYDAPGQLRAIAVVLDGFLTDDGARIIATHDADGDARDVFEQTDALVTYAGEVRAENAAVTAALDDAGVSTHDLDGRRYTLAERVQVGVFRVAVGAKHGRGRAP